MSTIDPIGAAPSGSGSPVRDLLPSPIVTADRFGDVPSSEAELFPEEEEAIARSVDKRRREFTTVRHCARRALAELGFAPVPLVPGERGAPSWPAGVVGSMTHCDGYRAVAVARAAEVASVGIDAEPAKPLPDGVFEAVTIEAERGPLAALMREQPDVPWDRLLFCAKESVYKAWFPLMRKWLGFEEAHITFRKDGTFDARLLVPGPTVGDVRLDGFTGRWLVAEGIAATAIVVGHTPLAPLTPAPRSAP